MPPRTMGWRMPSSSQSGVRKCGTGASEVVGVISMLLLFTQADLAAQRTLHQYTETRPECSGPYRACQRGRWAVRPWRSTPGKHSAKRTCAALHYRVAGYSATGEAYSRLHLGEVPQCRNPERTIRAGPLPLQGKVLRASMVCSPWMHGPSAAATSWRCGGHRSRRASYAYNGSQHPCGVSWMVDGRERSRQRMVAAHHHRDGPNASRVATSPLHSCLWRRLVLFG
jgi:hypothetical protein